jgi:branched-chain amino acid transport system substrate-binding protein
MRRRLGLFAGLLSLSLVAAGCTSDADSGGDIFIGVNLEQTGTFGQVATPELNAIRLVADNINRDGGVLGRQIKLVVKDNRSDTVEARRHTSDLIENDQIVGIIGSGTSNITLAFADLVEQKKVPTISMGAADTIVKNKKYLFKTPPDGVKFLEVMMQDMATVGVKKVGLMAVDDAYGDNGVVAANAATKQSGMAVVGTERFSAKSTDHTELVQRIVEQEPGAILVSAVMPAAAVAAKAIKASGFKGRVYFDGGAGADLFIQAGKSAEGMFMVHSSILAANQLTATTPSALAQKEFFVSYTQRHSSYSGYASYSADAMNLMVQGIRAAKSTDREKVRDAIEGLSYDGLTGSFDFSPSNHGGASGDGLTVLTVRNGGWVLAQ